MRKGIDENFLCSLFKSTANNRIECIDQIKFHSLLTIFEFTEKKQVNRKIFVSSKKCTIHFVKLYGPLLVSW